MSDDRTDDFMKLFRQQDIDKTKRIIGPGPFFCSYCGKKMIESGHMVEKFFMCEDAGEFTWSPDSWVRVEIDGTSYVVADKDTDVDQQRRYFEMCADAHARSSINRDDETLRAAVASNDLKAANDRRRDRGGFG